MHKPRPAGPYGRSLLNFARAAALISLTVFAPACRRPGPDERSASPMAALRATMEAAQRGDWEGYKRGLSKAMLRQDEEAAKREGLSLDEKYRKQLAGAAVPEMRNEKIEGDKATVEIRANMTGNEWVTLPFVKEDGEWKVARERYGEVPLFPDGKTTTKKKENPLLPAPTGRVNDFAEAIDGASKKRLEEILKGLEKRRGVEFFVATVKTTGGTNISHYTQDVMEDWAGMGRRAGVLLLLAIDDRQFFFSVSSRLESELPDSFLGEAGELLKPSARKGNYGEGILKSVNAVVARLESKGADGKPKPAESKRR